MDNMFAPKLVCNWVLVEVVQHDLGHGVALDLHDDPQTHAVAGLILDVGDAGQAAVTHLFGDRGDEIVVVNLVRQFGDDDRGSPVASSLDLDDTPHTDRPTAGGVGVDDALVPDNQTGGGEVRPLDPFDHGRQRGLFVGVVVLQAPVNAVANSRRLCGGMLVAMPTAMPPLPLASRLGKRLGRTVGSWTRRRSWG